VTSRAAPRISPPPKRSVALGLGFVRFGLQRLGPYLVVFVAYLLLATALLHVAEAKSGQRDFGAELYAIYTQLFFEPTANLPSSGLGRAIFWVTPLVGAAVVGGGIVRIGSELLSPAERLKLWTQLMTDSLSMHVVVCGIGHVGFRVIEQLRELGASVVAIERAESPYVERIRALGVPVTIGDARRDELLEKLGVGRARAIVCATDDDLANLEVALDAKRMNPNIRVVMRMFDQTLAGKVGGALDLDQSFSTSALSAPLVALSALHAGVQSAYRLGNQVFVTCEVQLSKLTKSTTVAAVEAQITGRIVSVERGGTYELAKPESKLEPGAKVVLDLEEKYLEPALKRLAAMA
jgi:voltage-gated potassium channel